MSLESLQALAQKEIDEDSRSNSGNKDGIPIVYPHENGTFRIKLIYKEEAGIIQKKITRHIVGDKKLPCLSMFGQECPICEAIRRAEDNFGRDCGAYTKYGSKTRGISYAVLVDYDKGMFEGKNDPKRGDLILFMYPPTLYNEINKNIVKAGPHIESLVAKNEGKTIEITRSQKKGGFPEYSVGVYAYGDEKVKDTEDEWQDLLASIPNIQEAIIPKNPTEEILNDVRVAAETINVEFKDNKVMDPNREVSEVKQDQDNGKAISESVPETPSMPEPEPQTNTQDSSNPECFGQHDPNNNKCLICPAEAECLMSKK